MIQMNRLNDSHAQLMVHWLGEGTNVMLCLAREPPPSANEEQKSVDPSSVYISYDNGDTFLDKTLLFRVNVTNGNSTIEKNSTIDQFTTHPLYNTVSERTASSRMGRRNPIHVNFISSIDCFHRSEEQSHIHEFRLRKNISKARSQLYPIRDFILRVRGENFPRFRQRRPRTESEFRFLPFSNINHGFSYFTRSFITQRILGERSICCRAM